MENVVVIVTVLNEQRSIIQLLESLTHQTRKPDQVIVADGGSTDDTLALMRAFQKTYPKLTVIQKKGNRSVGRNAAIAAAKTSLIAITDAGCIPHQNWLAELLKKYKETKAPVISGYYDAATMTPFEEAVVPYALVMSDRVNEREFLPATRSMLIEKKLFEKLGGFNTKLSDNEDYEFAQRLKAAGVQIAFAREAKVTWKPRQNFLQFFWMIYRFARGDMFAGIVRPKVMVLFLRYSVALFIGVYFLALGKFLLVGWFGGVGLLSYSWWAVAKNRRYTPNGWYWLPLLQFTADAAVLIGSTEGYLRRGAAGLRRFSTDSS